MKKIFILSLFLFGFNNSWAQEHKIEIETFQKELDAHYADKEHSPLPENEIKNFKGLPFFSIDSTYRVKASLVKNKYPKVFKMKTSTARKPDYEIYGTLHFEIDGKKQQLEVYRSAGIAQSDYLFLPFTDSTNGYETYGSGRYIDLKTPTRNTVTLDFNKAYNPYCAYNKKYSCPIPPKANRLKIPIKAGVKYAKH